MERIPHVLQSMWFKITCVKWRITCYKGFLVKTQVKSHCRKVVMEFLNPSYVFMAVGNISIKFPSVWDWLVPSTSNFHILRNLKSYESECLSRFWFPFSVTLSSVLTLCIVFTVVYFRYNRAFQYFFLYYLESFRLL
jgi:hypothetical protein